MKRIILSRKGFDAKAGGSASPIFSDGRLFSIPIPQREPSPTKYKDLMFNGVSGRELLAKTSSNIDLDDYCHFDPLLNRDIGIFGQAGSSQSELMNNNITLGDLFLFFGWFKTPHIQSNDLHHLFGWLQIDRIIKGSSNIKQYLQEVGYEHPHGYGDTSRYSNNAIYIGKKNLEIKKKTLSLKGHGLFKNTHKDLVLTENGKSRSRWKLPEEYFANSSNLFLNRLKWEDKEKFKIFYKGYGQEFVLNAEDNPKIIRWAKCLIEEHG